MRCLMSTSLPVPRIRWPEGKDFAFTIFDDTDLSTLENVPYVYDFLTDHGFRTTKSVWPLRGEEEPYEGGMTCNDPQYLRWVRSLQAVGFEIAFHGATGYSALRDDIRRGFESFRELFGHDPITLTNHSRCRECIYWGSDRLSGLHRVIYDLATLFRSRNRFRGHVAGDPHFWGDLCRQRVKYVRDFAYPEVNTLKACPVMPYHDPRRPYVNHWFASSEGAIVATFNRCLAEAAQDRLEDEGGACIMYTHFAFGFYEQGDLNTRFVSLMKRLGKKNGWFVPVRTLLDYLLDVRGPHTITVQERRHLERRWLWSKLTMRGDH